MISEKQAHAPPWLFGLTNLPFGVGGTYAGVAVPFLLHKAGLDIKSIAAIGSLALMPATFQLFWAPVIDLGIRRRSWLILLAFLGGLLLGATLLLDLPRQLGLYKLLLVLGEGCTGLVASCNGALVATTLPPELRSRAAGWVNAGNLGASVLGGGLIMHLATHYSQATAAAGMFLIAFLPALVALLIHELPPLQEPLVPHLSRMFTDVSRAVRSRTGWTGLLFCLSPVGTMALMALFSALGSDYHASDNLVENLNGIAGGLITAASSLASGYLLTRVNCRHAYLASGALTAVCAAAMALAPKTPTTMVVGAVFYLIIAGLAFTAFSAVAYDIVGNAGSSAGSLYSVFPAAGNLAIAYTLYFDGWAHDSRYHLNGLLWMDAYLNLAGVVALLCLLRFLVPERVPTAGPSAYPSTSDTLQQEGL